MRQASLRSAGLEPDDVTVLLVEDNPAYIRLVRELLNETGLTEVEMEWVDTLEKAQDRLDAEPVDLVLLDLILPDSAGRHTVQAVLDRVHGTPIIVLTGLDDDELAKQALNLGATDYLRKGQLGPERLARAIRYALGSLSPSSSDGQSAAAMDRVLSQAAAELRDAAEILGKTTEHLDPLAPEPLEALIQERGKRFEAAAETISQIQALRTHPPPQGRLSLGTLFEDVLHRLSAEGITGGRLQGQVDEEATVMGDPETLSRLLTLVLTRLLGREREGTDSLHVETTARTDRFELRIQDPAPLPGAQRTLDALFSLQTPATHLPGPLAQTLCEAILDSHDGRWWLAPSTGDGFQITITLPAAPQTPQPIDALGQASPEAGEQEGF